MAKSYPAKRFKGEANWKQSDKDRAVAAYSATGSFSKAATLIGIPENTVRYWAKQDWFDEALRRVDRADNQELKSTFTKIAKKAAIEIEDRLERGDEYVTKEGQIIMKKIPGKELANILSVATDKRKIVMDQPETVAIQNTTEKLASLMEAFLKFNNAKEIPAEATEVIDAEQPELQEKL